MKNFSIQREIGGKILSLETGGIAMQAGGAVICRYGDTVVLVTATASDKPREGVDFFPLTVDFEEKLYAGGKIPGSFFKREGRPPEKSILTDRLIDRPLRPLFPDSLRNEVHIVVLVLSADRENDPDILGLIGASAALLISDIPFDYVVGAVRVGRKAGEFLINPTYQELVECDLNVTLVSTQDKIMIIEAAAKEVDEQAVMDAISYGSSVIAEVIAMLKELQEKAGKPKRIFPEFVPDKDLEALFSEKFSLGIREILKMPEKQQRDEAFAALIPQAMQEVNSRYLGEGKEHLLALLSDSKNRDIPAVIEKIRKEQLKKMVIEEGARPDGRKLDEIRPINCKVSLFPRTHGSALFTRGETQVLANVTLGTVSDRQRLDNLGIDEYKRYLHHYNFPSFSVGETRPLRGPGRREIGHGALAEKAILPMIPSEEDFPYTIRLVSEVLSSNGSTSMASTCASSLALMDAGAPIKRAVAGVAMGLLTTPDNFVVLTDIQGMEDALGEMDFKVAGTSEGITAAQLDIKVPGISEEILKTALLQAKKARFQILEEMNQALDKPREDLSPYAPRIIIMQIHPDKIREVIGTGGKVIQKIIADTGATIDIEDDGRIFIAAVDQKAGEAARRIIEEIVRDVIVGEIYQGKVTRITGFGAFVELFHGKEGLLHISQISNRRIDKVEDVFKVGDETPVRVREIDQTGKVSLTRIGLVGEEAAEVASTARPERHFFKRNR